MKKIFTNAYFKTFIILLINLFAIEIIFRLVGGYSLLSFSTLRIFIGDIIVTSLIAFCLNFSNPIIKRIVTLVCSFALGVYSCAQLGFKNFLGVYMSLQTSSQFGAVVDYITDFIKSFHLVYFLTLLPFILSLVYFIVFDKKTFNNNIKILKCGIITISLLIVSCSLYTCGVLSKKFQSKYQTVSNKDLFINASNPSVVVDQYGTLYYLILDVKTMIHPIEVEKTYEIKNEEEQITDNSRKFDDSNWKELITKETDKNLNTLNNYYISQSIEPTNNYTGLFEGKNLIVIMMESANDILINEEYYPNFYKLLSEGWYWENNYSPRNSCATMNNEFSGITSLYSIYNTCTASKYKPNTYYESLFNLFNNKDYITFSAHDYTEAYYPRKTIHTNLGSGEYYGVQKLGITYSNEYKNWANDDEFMASVLKIIDDKTSNGEQFMTWLTTVSSHQPYSVDSTQGDKYYSMTKNTKYPSDVRRYMSKLKILDDALGVLLEGLEQRGILDDTVIVLYGDHYPYGINTKNLNKVLDYDTSSDLNAERVPFVIYNSTITSKTYSEYTSYINILPTLANLFNLDYDPRLYMGNDLLSENYDSLVVFADGSWKNEIAFYDASKNKIKYYTEEKYSQDEIQKINDMINEKITYSGKSIRSNYFNYLNNSLKKIEEEHKEEKLVCTSPDDDSC